jgi:hypothetical protein
MSPVSGTSAPRVTAPWLEPLSFEPWSLPASLLSPEEPPLLLP